MSFLQAFGLCSREVLPTAMTCCPLVTIITPTYNQADYLPETIESVLAQTYPNIEYLVIDDGSKDETPTVLERYRDRLQVIRQDNMGQSRTINRGVDLARGEIVGYLSSDDVLHSTAVARLVEVLVEDEGVVCAFPDSDLIDPTSKVIKRKVCRPFDASDLLVRQECYIGPGALYRTEDARIVGGWRPELRLAPDREFWLRLSARGRFHFVQESLAGYRTHPGSTSYAVVSEAQSREYLSVLDDFYDDGRLEPALQARRDEAYGYANFLIARNCLRGGQFMQAFRYYHRAVRLHSPLLSPQAVLMLFKSSVSKGLRLLYHRLGKNR